MSVASRRESHRQRLPALARPRLTIRDANASVAWGLKLYGSRLARELYVARMQPLMAAAAAGPRTVPLSSKLCEQADFETKWFVHWCRELKMEPIYHRKIWEDCFALQAIWEAGLLRPGVSALCFGAGEEPLPSYLASCGVDVLAESRGRCGGGGLGRDRATRDAREAVSP